MGSPFDSGKTLVFKSMSTAGPKHYIDSSPDASQARSVYLSASIRFNVYPGTHWECSKQRDGSYRLKTVSAQGSSDKRILDSSSANPQNVSTYLNTDSAGGGSFWTPTLLADGSYSLQSQTPSGPKRFMCANPTASQEESVYLVENSDSIEAHWMVGVDYYTSAEVERIINEVYPSATINFYQSDARHGSLYYGLLNDIWKSSELDKYQRKGEKFDCDDFAVCMKAEVSKYSYNETFPDNRDCLCGIMWGKNSAGEHHAYNFTIDPFGELILLEPQNGLQIAPDKYTPYFCMV